MVTQALTTFPKWGPVPSYRKRNGAGRLVAVVLGGAGAEVHEGERPSSDSAVG